jgi:hypothetical protein
MNEDNQLKDFRAEIDRLVTLSEDRLLLAMGPSAKAFDSHAFGLREHGLGPQASNVLR